MTISIGESILLAIAGAVAGVVGSAGGITSLVSYPALLVVGVPPLPANVANLVASVAMWPGSALTSRRELAAVRRSWSWGLPVAVSGAAAGSVLLLSTPSDAFSRVVPFLVAAGSVVLLAQPWLSARLRNPRHRPQLLALPLVGLVSVYTGYFGAGCGVLLLAVVLVLVDTRLPEANAMKNMLVGAGTLAATVVFVVAGPVDWHAVAPLAVGLFAGSTAGPVVARRLSPTVVRWMVAAIGIALAIELWVNPS